MVIFNTDFYAGEMLRWNLWWPSPNFAGAFVVTLCPLLWGLMTLATRHWRPLGLRAVSIIVLCLVEAGAIFVLCKTYSRGALVAFLAAIAVYCICLTKRRNASESSIIRAYLIDRQFLQCLFRVLSLAVAIFATGFEDRIADASALVDKSATNRLQLWRGSVEMISASPLMGWGAGNAGTNYMNWFQPLSDDSKYATPVNSYLHIGVEYGAVALLLVLAGAATVISTGVATARSRRADDLLAITSGIASASIAAWAVANVFSTLWVQWSLWLVPAIAILLFAAVGGARFVWTRASLRRTGVCIGIFCCIVASMVWWGRAQEKDIEVGSPAKGRVILSRAGESTTATVLLWVDPEVCGPSPGKEIRRWFVTSQPAGTIEVADIGQSTDSRVEAPYVLLFGRHAERLEHIPEFCDVWLVHPSGEPPAQIRNRVNVILPEIDEDGDTARWATWARRGNAVVSISPLCGKDIRPAWPFDGVKF